MKNPTRHIPYLVASARALKRHNKLHWPEFIITRHSIYIEDAVDVDGVQLDPLLDDHLI